jgi:hypothetical protein
VYKDVHPGSQNGNPGLNPMELQVRSRTTLLLGMVLLFGTTAFAQDHPKIEVSANYSYMRFNPHNNLPALSAFSANGGGEAFSYFLTDMIGIKAEFAGYGGTTETLSKGASVSGNLYT